MLKRAFPSALIAAVLGVAASGSSVPDFAQNVPARCLPQEMRAGLLPDECGGIVTFGVNGPMVLSGQAPDIEATGSINRNGRDSSVEGSREHSE
ncbi:hypothetical protein [Microvirga mediterraneensis]|uniref:Porin n=1 Tax=Microvirga mediterraneensis TaxID=2754695 RepID=A0A838BUD5_9HYPH|nr:hypothetical protein [Microvirga mediterraneensis]MBA1158958.1 hypothetical protein [Microvirga mediterraneensis]